MPTHPINAWKEAGPELERIKEQELRSMSNEEAASQAREVLALASQWLEAHPGYDRPSGMVEQQHWFRKWKHQD